MLPTEFSSKILTFFLYYQWGHLLLLEEFANGTFLFHLGERKKKNLDIQVVLQILNVKFSLKKKKKRSSKSKNTLNKYGPTIAMEMIWRTKLGGK